MDVSPSLSLLFNLLFLFQGNWFGPAVINQIEAFVRGGGTPHMKGVGMLVVSLKGLDFEFWFHLGCKTPSYLAVKVSFRVARDKI